MKRIHIHITEKQEKALDRLVKEDGIKFAELVRRAIDCYLDNRSKNKKRRKS